VLLWEVTAPAAELVSGSWCKIKTLYLPTPKLS